MREEKMKRRQGGAVDDGEAGPKEIEAETKKKPKGAVSAREGKEGQVAGLRTIPRRKKRNATTSRLLKAKAGRRFGGKWNPGRKRQYEQGAPGALRANNARRNPPGCGRKKERRSPKEPVRQTGGVQGVGGKASSRAGVRRPKNDAKETQGGSEASGERRPVD